MNFIPLTKQEDRRIKTTTKSHQNSCRFQEISIEQESIQQYTSSTNNKPGQIIPINNYAQAEISEIISNSFQRQHANKQSQSANNTNRLTKLGHINFSQRIQPISILNCKKDECIEGNIYKKDITDAYQIKKINKDIDQIDKNNLALCDNKIHRCINGINSSSQKFDQNKQFRQMFNEEARQAHPRRPIFPGNKPTIILIPTTSEETTQKKAVTPSKRKLRNEILLSNDTNASPRQEQQIKRKNSQTIVLRQFDTYQSNEDSVPLKMRRRLSPYSKQTIKPINRRNYQKQKPILQLKKIQYQQQIKNKYNQRIDSLRNDTHTDNNLKLSDIKPAQGWDQQHQIFKIFNIPPSSRQSSHINLKKPLNSLLLK